MSSLSHKDQKRIWEEEHKSPHFLPQIDAHDASGGVVRFWKWFKNLKGAKKIKGVEMGCGKGRNGIWLAREGVEMKSFDFSSVAIQEAKLRAEKENVKSVEFLLQDATERWPFPDNHFDFGIDCFGSTDIESLEGRAFARDEFIRVLKPGGFLFIYTLSTDDEFYGAMIEESPADEKNAFLHPATGKFEKSFDRKELLEFYKNLELVKEERIEKTATFFGKEYYCKHFWLVLQKPA